MMSMTYKRLPIFALAGLLAACGGEQQAQPPIETRAPVPALPSLSISDMMMCADELAPLIPDTGTFSRSISASAEIAQAYFDQGMRLSYSYYFPEAIASFDAALCFEPHNALVYWGKALAIGPNPNSRYGGSPDDPVGAGKDAIGRALALRETMPAPERGLIDAVAVLFDTDRYPDQGARTLAFIEAAEANYTAHGNDLEAAFLVAHGIMMSSPWTYFSYVDGSPLPMMDRARQVLEEGMARRPDHPGLTHLHIHLMEASFEPESAVASADRLESLTPMAGHMVHMPGHIYMRVGRYDDAITTNQRSLDADDYVQQQWGNRPLPRTGTYFLSATNHGGHARMFIHWAGILQGNFERASSVSAPMLMMANPDNLARGSGLRTPVSHWMTLRAFGKFAELQALTNPAPGQPYLSAMLNWMHGAAYASFGDIQMAERELAALSATRQNSTELGSMRANTNTAADLLVIAEHMLAGEIANARQDYASAVAHFEHAVDLQDKLRYMEPPDWLQSTRLFLGQALINAGRPADAVAVFERDLLMLNENGWALFGLALALEESGDAERATEIRRRQAQAWADADVQLTAAHF
jgi:tetratricopeptide (TPR) repeat protein